MAKIVLEELLYLGGDGHGDRSIRLFDGHKCFYDGQWQLTDRYCKRCYTTVKFRKHSLSFYTPPLWNEYTVSSVYYE